MTDYANSIDHEQLFEFAKKRALELLEQGQLIQAIDSMVADISKDPKTLDEQKSVAASLGLALRNDPDLNEGKVREFIEGFNVSYKETIKKLEQLSQRNHEPNVSETPEGKQRNAENVIARFVDGSQADSSLTDAAKDLLRNTILTKPGPWQSEDFIESITQKDKQIIIKNRQKGTAFLYLE